MAQDKKDNRIVLKEQEAQAKLLEGARAVYEAVSSTYGPRGRNVLIEKPFGRPLLTRDGITVARDTYFSDRAKNMGASMIREASENTTRISGDGTSATAILSYFLAEYGNQSIASGVHPMEIKDQLSIDKDTLLEELEKLAQPVKKGQLEQVATVSSGDPLLGKLIADTIDHVGVDGGIITEKAFTSDVEREYIDGYFLQQGFQALPSGRKELVDPFVIVSSKRISSSADIVEILNRTVQAKNIQPGQIARLLFIGNFEEAAYRHIVELINKGAIDAIIIKTPPNFGEMGRELLEDIAVYANCQPITEATNLKNFATQTGDKLYSPYIGSVDKAVATHTESTVFADNNSGMVKDRITAIKERLEAETSDFVAEKLRDRIAKLEGKVAIFKIGGATDTRKEEVEFRVEDSIQASRAALSNGVVPGGGATLVYLSKCDISVMYKKALQSTFKQLLVNANYPAELKLAEILNAPYGHGYNIRKSDKLVNLVKEGILDPALVVEQVITNASTTVADMLSTGVVEIFEDRE